MTVPIHVPEDQSAYLVPKSEIDERVRRLQAALSREGVDLALVTHGADLYYFTGTYQVGTLFVPADGEPVLFANKSVERARAESPLADVRAAPRLADMAANIRAAIHARGPLRVGLNMDLLPAAQYLRLLQAFGGPPAADASPAIRALRSVKSAWEIEQVKQAAARVAPIFESMGDLFLPGMTELDLSARIEHRLRLSGHPGMVRVRRPGQEFAMLVVSAGPSAAYPIHLVGPIGFAGLYPPAPPGAGRRPIREGDTFMADIVTYYNGYQADHARTFAAGHAGDAVLRAHEFCRGILDEITSRMKPAAVCAAVFGEVALIARERGEPEGFMGFGENRVKFFGHGVGIELDEFPVLALGFDTPLEAGMVLAVEPKAFSLSHGPAGLENSYLVTAAGAESLCAAEEDLVVLK